MAAYPPAEPKQPHPLPQGFTMALLAFTLHVVVRALGVEMDHGLGYVALGSLIAGATSALAGYGKKALVAFAVTGTLGGFGLWWALIPALLIMDFRIVRRVIMLSHRDRTAPVREPRRGFWGTLQFWVGWNR
ncbi:hypothetical protein [Streptomyces sp. NPDC001536]|uniref:hypothetical protein n=1 Tax=Streptomyces sp. NPDC001536 TaxID=3364583 RepID=UPI00368E496A